MSASKHVVYRCKQWLGLPSSSMATMQRMGTCSAPVLLSRTDQASEGSVGYVGACLPRDRGGGGGGVPCLHALSTKQDSEAQHLCLAAHCTFPELAIAALHLLASLDIQLGDAVTTSLVWLWSLPAVCGAAFVNIVRVLAHRDHDALVHQMYAHVSVCDNACRGPGESGQQRFGIPAEPPDDGSAPLIRLLRSALCCCFSFVFSFLCIPLCWHADVTSSCE